MEFTDTNNHAELTGVIYSEPAFSHEVFGEAFYLFFLEVPRLSGTSDIIRIIASERLFQDAEIEEGKRITVIGQFRSYNLAEEGTNRLILSVFAKDILPPDKTENKNPNSLYLNGYLCKEPVFRETPFGREIADLLLAVNRTYNKSDYIPIITWGRNARFSKHLSVGEKIEVWGRIQSRTYQKRVGDDDFVEKVAYEVSVSRLKI
ncbi:MAG: single-stranded DNA-binding protein [Clostridia bacterium]|nr:single-stranded DNA-binding protein [Clostridia bacterium]